MSTWEQYRHRPKNEQLPTCKLTNHHPIHLDNHHNHHHINHHLDRLLDRLNDHVKNPREKKTANTTENSSKLIVFVLLKLIIHFI